MLKKVLLIVMTAMMLFTAACDFSSDSKGKVEEKNGTEVEQTAAVEKDEITVYRVQKNGSEYLVPEKVEYARGDKTAAFAAMDALINIAPAEKNLKNIFPAGTKVRSVSVIDHTAYVDFNKAFAQKESGGSYYEMMLINSVVCTLTEIPGIEQVKFLVDGKDIDSISGHMDLLDPIRRNSDMIKPN